MLIYDEQGHRIAAQCAFGIAHDPFHAEAKATLQALTHIHTRTLGGHQERYAIYTDCKVLVEILENRNLEAMPSWRATETVANCLQRLTDLQHMVTISYAREGKPYTSLIH